MLQYEGRSIGRGCYPDAFSFDAPRNFVQHAFVTSSLGDPPSIVALGKRIGDGVVLKDSLDQRSQLLPQKERTNLGHLHDPIFGGGKSPTSKQEFQQVLHAGLANRQSQH